MMSERSSGKSKTAAFCAWLGEEQLNRALVAGLMLEVILSHPKLPQDLKDHRCHVKSRLKTTLVSRLAGHIPLSSFRDLAQNLDQWFDFYYPLITSPSSISRQNSGLEFVEPPPNPLREDLLRESLELLNGLLPMRRHRKLDRYRLFEFLRRTGGVWFRLKDFEQFFHIDRKTAWEYIQKLLNAGLLNHNQARSAAVRYRLAPRFLEQGSGE